MSKGSLLIHAGYASSGPASKAFAALVENGWMISDAGQVAITPAGEHELGSIDPLPTGEELREQTLRDLTPMEEGTMLAKWFECYPDAATKGKILELTGYASSGPASRSALPGCTAAASSRSTGTSTRRAISSSHDFGGYSRIGGAVCSMA